MKTEYPDSKVYLKVLGFLCLGVCIIVILLVPARLHKATLNSDQEDALRPPLNRWQTARQGISDGRAVGESSKEIGAGEGSVKEEGEVVPAQGPPSGQRAHHDESAVKGFAIQMHSFQIENKAQDAASSLTAQGYHAYIKEVDLGAKGIWYRVMVGDFSSSQEAQEKLNELKKIKEDGFVVKLP